MKLEFILAAIQKLLIIRYNRHGSLFQRHTKAEQIDNLEYFITLITYIHQNPIRARLVKNLEDWPFSSYLDLAGKRNGTLVDKKLIYNHFKSTEEFIRFSNKTINL